MSQSPAARPHTRWGRTIGIALGAALIVGVLLLAFTWPAKTSTVHNIPLAVSGPTAQVAAITEALEAEGTFTVAPATDRADAVAQIESRDVYGAIVLGAPPEVLTASANGAALSQIFQAVALQVQSQANQAAAAGAAAAGQPAPPAVTVSVTDVVPLAATDARGAGLASAAFPLALGGMLGGVLVSLLVVGTWRRLFALGAYTILASCLIVAVMQGWYGALQGDAVLNLLAIALALLGTSSLIVGLNAAIGTAGIGVGAVITLFVANPISAAAQPLQFLPEPWGAVGQWFVPGASVSLLRDLSYFPAADALFPWLVLVGWASAGVVLAMIGHFRNQEVVHVEGALETDVVRAA
jgi:hypothetical protein